MATSIARGMRELNHAPDIEAEGRIFRFLGIWSKNREEWLITHLAGMYFNHTTIGFYDAQSAQTVDFILNQTLLTTIYCSNEYTDKLTQMKADGQCTNIRTIVSFDPVTE